MSRELQVKQLLTKSVHPVFKILLFAILMVGIFLMASSYERHIQTQQNGINNRVDNTPVTLEFEGAAESLQSDKTSEQFAEPLVIEPAPEENTQNTKNSTQQVPASSSQPSPQTSAEPKAQNNPPTDKSSPQPKTTPRQERRSSPKAETKPKPSLLCFLGLC